MWAFSGVRYVIVVGKRELRSSACSFVHDVFQTQHATYFHRGQGSRSEMLRRTSKVRHNTPSRTGSHKQLILMFAMSNANSAK